MTKRFLTDSKTLEIRIGEKDTGSSLDISAPRFRNMNVRLEFADPTNDLWAPEGALYKLQLSKISTTGDLIGIPGKKRDMYINSNYEFIPPREKPYLVE